MLIPKQLNLVVGDYFKSNKALLKRTDDATELIKWLRSKTFVLALLNEAQIKATGTAKAVIRAVLTRWTAHYMAYRRLLELQHFLTSLVYTEDTLPEHSKQIVTGDRDAKTKATAMVKIIKDPMFWHAITR